jgi:predicted neutral ceramidase superfamily lipid hydrolase
LRCGPEEDLWVPHVQPSAIPTLLGHRLSLRLCGRCAALIARQLVIRFLVATFLIGMALAAVVLLYNLKTAAGIDMFEGHSVFHNLQL